MTAGALRKMFTERELSISASRKDRAEYLAGRFAAKEACFKAIASGLQGGSFDLRIIETMSREDGSPYIRINKELETILQKAGISTLHISISHNHGEVSAFAIAEG